jgi:hypothetical protein
VIDDLVKSDERDFADVMATPAGARVAARIIDDCRTFTANADGNPFREGMRNTGLMLYSRILNTTGGEAAYIAARDARSALFDRGGENEYMRGGEEL